MDRVKPELTEIDIENFQEMLCRHKDAYRECNKPSACARCIFDAPVEEFKAYLLEQLNKEK